MKVASFGIPHAPIGAPARKLPGAGTISPERRLRYDDPVASVRPPVSASAHPPALEEPLCCDGCNAPLTHDDIEERGKGVFLWVRGEERRYDEVPLCPNCGTAIGMAVLARFAQEEEEG